MANLSGKVVMVTGASEGLGLQLAIGLTKAGAAVSICSRRAEAIHAVGDRMRALGGRVLAQSLDVSDAESVERWVSRTVEELGPIRSLINNASLLGPRVPLADFPVDQWRQVLDVNLTGTFLACRAVLPGMLERADGSIVNVSSGAALPPRRMWGAYAVAKSAVEAFTSNLAAELHGTGVRVNAVDPGAMRTRMRAAAYPDEDPARLKGAESIVPLFVWLASDEAAEVTGERIEADAWLRRESR